MCAAMPLRPFVVTLPLTEWSSFTVIVPPPEAEVLTGGTSSAPLSVTLLPLLNQPPTVLVVEFHAELIVSQPARPSAAATTTAGAYWRKMLVTFIGSSRERWVRNKRGRRLRCIPYGESCARRSFLASAVPAAWLGCERVLTQEG